MQREERACKILCCHLNPQSCHMEFRFDGHSVKTLHAILLLDVGLSLIALVEFFLFEPAKQVDQTSCHLCDRYLHCVPDWKEIIVVSKK